MVDVFCTKYFHGEETVMLTTLQETKQRSGKDLMEYIKRFRDIALDCYDHCEERTLVEMCMKNMIREYRTILENLEISQFAQLLQKPRKTAQSVKPSSDKRNAAQAMVVSTGEQRRKIDGREYDTPPPIPCTPKELDVLLDKWIVNGVLKPNQVSKEPTEEEWKDPRFCRLHNYVQHPIAECWALCQLVHCRIKEGTLELSQQEVQRNLLPNHKGKGVAAMVICANPAEDEEENPSLPAVAITTLQRSSKFKILFDQLGLMAKERKIATEALVNITSGARTECLSVEVADDRDLLQELSEITFSNEDMKMGYPDHRRPFYLAASINQICIKRALVDTGASVNLIPLSTL